MAALSLARRSGGPAGAAGQAPVVHSPPCRFPAADRVAVLEVGRIVEAGTHRALVQADGL